MYTICRFAAAVVFNTIGPVRYIGKENFDALEAPSIIICNHSSFFDPVIIAKPLKKYEITFLGKKELASAKLADWFLRKMHMISVDRGNSDMAAMRTCIKALRDGQILGIFPEGTRHHEGVMEHIESGVSLIALRSGKPLVPVYINRPYRLFAKTTCVIGKPIAYDDLIAQGINKDSAAALEERIKAVYSGLVKDYPFIEKKSKK
ncbi:MAG: lysophospholipid acyltransferase family protein [Clostridia bacterium]|nr:lysophospholipid acyltransferase family protein [Clostridia bacterium]